MLSHKDWWHDHGGFKAQSWHHHLNSPPLVEKLSFMTILCDLGCVIPNIHVTLDHFLVILDISYHFGQCHKKPCFLLVHQEIKMIGYSLSIENLELTVINVHEHSKKTIHYI